jgi:glycerol-3-phosphate dehydrogenase (NAD(P)+)
MHVLGSNGDLQLPAYHNITVIGAGAWGTALAAVQARNGHRVRIWSRRGELVDQINGQHENLHYLPGIRLPAEIEATADIYHALAGSDIVLLAAPAQTTRSIVGEIARHLRRPVPMICCAKGIARETGQLQTEILKSQLPECIAGVLSGPSFADDVARGLPTAVVLAAPDQSVAQDIAAALSSRSLRLYASGDPVGVQLGGALKNVMAIAVGICRGGGLGASAEAALTTRGYAEIARLAIALGGRPETLTGLSGLGDLILTCSSTMSRNFSYGIAVGRGEDVSNSTLAEGVHTIAIANRIARERNIDCPIMEVTEAVLDARLSLHEALQQLMNRPVRAETH